MTDKKSKLLTNNMVLCLTATLCCALWGSAFPGIKIGYSLFNISADDFRSQILFAGLRFLLSGILTIIFGSIVGKEFMKPRKSSWGRIVKLCIFQTVLQYLFFYIGLAHASGVKASIIEGSNVFVAILMVCLIFRQESLSLEKVIGCVLGFAGVVLVNLNGAKLDLNMSFIGEGFIFLSTIAYALSSVLIKNYSKYDSPVMLSGYQFVCGGLIMIALGFFSGGRLTLMTLPGAAMLFYLSFLSAMAYALWSLLLKYNPVSKVSVWGFTNPVFGVIFSMLFLNESKNGFGMQTVAALIFVCLGIYIVNKVRPDKQL